MTRSDYHIHGDLGDAEPGHDPDFKGKHLDRDGPEIPKKGAWEVVPIEGEMHWSEREALGYKATPSNWVQPEADNEPQSPEQAGWDDIAG